MIPMYIEPACVDKQTKGANINSDYRTMLSMRRLRLAGYSAVYVHTHASMSRAYDFS